MASIGALAVTTSMLMPPAFAQQTFHPTMKQSTIKVNGNEFSTQYEFVYNGTTYMPIWYVMQVLNRIKGVTAYWDGTNHEWTIGTDGGAGSFVKLHVTAKGGQTGILINAGMAESHIITLVARDPRSHVMTTFMPIWYIQQALNAIGLTPGTDVWNGVSGHWNLNFTMTSKPNTGTPSAPSMAGFVTVMNEFEYVSIHGGTLAGYSPLATKTQWYPDPSDIFFNKRFPLSDLKNNKVLQTKPYIIMMNDGPNGGTPSWIALQYVGKGPNSKGTETSYWMGESVNSSGFVTSIEPAFMPFPQSSFPNLNVPATGGYHFKGNPPHTLWGLGENLYVAPQPGWNPIDGNRGPNGMYGPNGV